MSMTPPGPPSEPTPPSAPPTEPTARPAGPPTQPAPLQAARPAPSNIGAFLVVAGGAGLAIGSLLPWAVARAVFIGEIEISGTEGDGVITLPIGIVVAILGLVLFNRPTQRAAGAFAVIGGFIGGVVAAIDISDVQDRVAEVEREAEGLATADVGYGLIITAVGAGVALLGGIITLNQKAPA